MVECLPLKHEALSPNSSISTPLQKKRMEYKWVTMKKRTVLQSRQEVKQIYYSKVILYKRELVNLWCILEVETKSSDGFKVNKKRNTGQGVWLK
jgi:hypothetical protein